MKQITKEEFLEYREEVSSWEECQVETGKDFHYKTLLYTSDVDLSLCWTTQPDAKGVMFSEYFIINN